MRKYCKAPEDRAGLWVNKSYGWANSIAFLNFEGKQLNCNMNTEKILLQYSHNYNQTTSNIEIPVSISC